MTDTKDITRPIIGIENRTAEEVFDIMVARISALVSPPTSSVEELRAAARREAFKDAANFVARHQIAHTSNGDILEPRGEGNKHGLAYATALAALSNVEGT